MLISLHPYGPSFTTKRHPYSKFIILATYDAAHIRWPNNGLFYS